MRCAINTQDIVHESLDGEIVIVNLKNGRYYTLLDTATTIWQGIEAGHTTRRIESDLRAQYRDEEGRISPCLAQFLQELKREGLVTMAEESPPSSSEPGGAAEERPGIGAPPFVEPVISTHVDMEGMLLLDPVHDVSEKGWPEKKAIES
jgi:hypothetical protein